MTGARYAALGTGMGRRLARGEHRAGGCQHFAGSRIEDRRQPHQATEQQLAAIVLADGAGPRVHVR
jgi:hypothetical protein